MVFSGLLEIAFQERLYCIPEGIPANASYFTPNKCIRGGGLNPILWILVVIVSMR